MTSIKLEQLFDNKEHLAQIVLKFGQKAFKSIDVPDKMLQFIVDNFVLTSNYSTDINALNDFCELYINAKNADGSSFNNDEIIDPTNSLSNDDPSEKKGTYGIVINYNNDPSKKIKYVKYDTTNFYFNLNHKEVRNEKDIYNVQMKFSWYVEFCSFVIIMAVLIFIDCNLIIDNTSRKACIDAKYINNFSSSEIKSTKDYFLSYCSFMAEVHAPFYKKISDTQYLIGYILKKYNTTISELYYSLSNEIEVIRAYNLTYQIFKIMHKMTHLNNIGITISHRDTTSNNIMITNNPYKKNDESIRLIDFGFLCSNIQCKNGDVVIFGQHSFDEAYENKPANNINLCNKPWLDIYLYIAYCIQYKPNLFFLLSSMCEFDIIPAFIKIITFDNNPYISEMIIEKIVDKVYIPLHEKPKNTLNDKAPIKAQTYKFNFSPWKLSANINEFVSKAVKTGLLTNELTTPDSVEKIFLDIFKLMDDIKNTIITKNALYAPYFIDIDYGTIKLFDISDTKKDGDLSKFYEIYKVNKDTYSKLSVLLASDSIPISAPIKSSSKSSLTVPSSSSLSVPSKSSLSVSSKSVPSSSPLTVPSQNSSLSVPSQNSPLSVPSKSSLTVPSSSPLTVPSSSPLTVPSSSPLTVSSQVTDINLQKKPQEQNIGSIFSCFSGLFPK